ncbi:MULTISPECIES: hypothetical protein [Myxococcus]|uniref:hypothetical protein n=1 Tax=Myxococcus TaxID=32 RepID=UPI0013D05273|nr:MULTISPECIES: hypothetical protein [Myxococcus]NVJ25521.1 hypothetical protein [Myxococcus sp. AM011]
MPTERLTFKIAWREPIPARLTYLIDNGTVITHPNGDDDRLTGTQEILFTYDAPKSDIHIIRWLLWFPEHTLTKLAATARRSSSRKFSPLNSQPGEQKIYWERSGAL